MNIINLKGGVHVNTLNHPPTYAPDISRIYEGTEMTD